MRASVQTAIDALMLERRGAGRGFALLLQQDAELLEDFQVVLGEVEGDDHQTTLRATR
ncbi:hypothetical protein D3C84_1271860 [compost metagenome]